MAEPQQSGSSDSQKAGQSVDSGGNGKSAFMTLAGYIFGKNDRQEKMAMTIPVMSDSSGRMQFFMGNNQVNFTYGLTSSADTVSSLKHDPHKVLRC